MRTMIGLERSQEATKNSLTRHWGRLIWSVILLIAWPWISEAAEPAAFVKTEKNRLEVGTAGSGTTSLPLFVALEGVTLPSAV